MATNDCAAKLRRGSTHRLMAATTSKRPRRFALPDLKDRRGDQAIEDFLERETRGIAHYIDELNEHGPFKAPSASGS